MSEKKLKFRAGDLSLEGCLVLPDPSSPQAAVVVCHPHPLYGGSMDNNVVYAVCSGLSRKSIVSLRFNFRGIGMSEGAYGDGIGEQEDTGSAISFLKSVAEVDPERIGLCGYSFGAGVALEVAAKDSTVKALGLVSPILDHPSPIETYSRPKLLLWGSQDLALPRSDLDRFTANLPDPREYQVVAGVDHFWWDHEDTISDAVGEFFGSWL